ncbi:hypothetical protein LSAT2_003055 [Lamellibrachia satsuma]|nr:hypothetical protein LSAT2_003055 [Lamellibrachia satsuma]
MSPKARDVDANRQVNVAKRQSLTSIEADVLQLTMSSETSVVDADKMNVHGRRAIVGAARTVAAGRCLRSGTVATTRSQAHTRRGRSTGNSDMTVPGLHRSNITRHHGYMRYTVPAWLHGTLGVLLVAVGTADLIWTLVKYSGSCDFEKTDNLDPCAANHVYTYIASPIWGGLLTVGLCVLGLKLPSYGLYRNKNRFIVYMWCSAAVAILLMPAVIALQLLELLKGKGYIYYIDNGNPVTDDTTKYAFIILLLTMAFAEAVIAVLAAVICLCFKPKQEQRILRWNMDYESSMASSRRPATLPLPPSAQRPQGYFTVLPRLYPVLTPANAWHPDASRWKPDLHPQPSNVACVYTVPRASHVTKPLDDPNLAWSPNI